MTRHAVPIIGMAVALAVAGGCKLGEIDVPEGSGTVVVQAVLNPSTNDQQVLVERTLTGSESIVDSGTYDPSNPIASGNGVPISGATVTVTDPRGVVLLGTEQLTLAKQGTGVYHISLAAANVQLIQGGLYQLLVRTPAGEVVTGTTRIPRQASSNFSPVIPFNRSVDTLDLSWLPVPGARAYWLNVQSPHSAFNSFIDSTSVRLPGLMRDVDDNELGHLFFPGFLQSVTVAAVDTNLYDYYQTANDPFTGSGLLNHLVGGIGVFGSAVILSTRTLDVRATPTDPIEGVYTLTAASPSAAQQASQLTLYVESAGTDGDGLSGSYLRPQLGGSREALLGTRNGSTIILQLLLNETASQESAIFTGTFSGDSIVGSYTSGGGTVVFVRSGGP